ncbi:hypothetical protein Tco_0682494 [Tanacetum coccineum]|uniref:Uncharacterized protein n=1 Tax=Tanacetum coccineum TaxID=301880 RepID=A0ABQ4XRB5_9ASTR
MLVNKRKSDKTGSTNNNCSGAAVGKVTWQPIKPKVRYELKAHGNLPKNGAPMVSTSVKDGSSKNQPAKAIDIPLSSSANPNTTSSAHFTSPTQRLYTQMPNYAKYNPYINPDQQMAFQEWHLQQQFQHTQISQHLNQAFFPTTIRPTIPTTIRRRSRHDPDVDQIKGKTY